MSTRLDRALHIYSSACGCTKAPYGGNFGAVWATAVTLLAVACMVENGDEDSDIRFLWRNARQRWALETGVLLDTHKAQQWF